MLNIKEIETYYPENLRGYKRFLLREYLQHKILEIIFDSSYADRLCFLGGTCLRIVHNNQRFSEDLDFDNFSMTKEEFDALSKIIETELQKLGYKTEIRQVMKGAYHCYIKFPSLLFDQGLSGYKEEKILIQLDTEPQNFAFEKETVFINKFDVFTNIFTTPLELVLAQKFYAILNRKRNKGRDFFDVVFLMGKSISPNYSYLEAKVNISNKETLKSAIIEKCNEIDMQKMTADVTPFLFNPKDAKMVSLFKQYFIANF